MFLHTYLLTYLLINKHTAIRIFSRLTDVLRTTTKLMKIPNPWTDHFQKRTVWDTASENIFYDA